MLLVAIYFLLFFSIIILFCIPKTKRQLMKQFSLCVSGFTLFLSSIILIHFNDSSFYFQYTTYINIDLSYVNLSYSFALDGVSTYFFFLTSLLIFFCITFVWEEKILKEYLLILLSLNLILVLVFSVLDLLLFYIFFEAVLIPMYLMIGILGSRERKIRAGYLFFFYTLVGSLIMLLALTYIYILVGTLNLEYLLVWVFSFNQQCWLWFAFFFSFASKIPMFPFHIWLPEAHVEAPTVGSVLLAGILLKMGVYGFLRFNILLFPLASIYFSPLIFLLSVIGVLYSSLTAVRQTDFKRVVAYSSIAHMNLIMLGLFSFNIVGIEGAILQSISHGFVSGALFLLIGILYDRYHSRLLYYYGGLVHTMPIYSVFFLFFTLANIALPGTSSFVGEFLILSGIYKMNTVVAVFGSLGVILCGAYSLWLYNRLIFGNIKFTYTLQFKDITLKEFSLLLPLVFLVLFLGFCPTFFSNFILLTAYNLSISD